MLFDDKCCLFLAFRFAGEDSQKIELTSSGEIVPRIAKMRAINGNSE